MVVEEAPTHPAVAATLKALAAEASPRPVVVVGQCPLNEPETQTPVVSLVTHNRHLSQWVC